MGSGVSKQRQDAKKCTKDHHLRTADSFDILTTAMKGCREREALSALNEFIKGIERERRRSMLQKFLSFADCGHFFDMQL